MPILSSVSSAGSSGYPCTTSVLPTTRDRPTATSFSTTGLIGRPLAAAYSQVAPVLTDAPLDSGTWVLTSDVLLPSTSAVNLSSRLLSVVVACLGSTAALNFAFPPPPPPPPFAPLPRPTYVSKRPWTFWLASSVDVEPIGELKARNRQLTWQMNRPGTLSCVVDMSHDLAPLLQELRACVLAIRDGVVRWGGPIWTAEDDMENHQINVTCMEWFERFNHRFVRPGAGAPTEPGTLAADMIWKSTPRAEIARWMIDTVNAKSPTGITLGAVESTPLIDWKYERTSFKYIGGEITQLTEIENGFDFRVDPQTRIMDIYAKMMVDRTQEVMFASGWGPDNLSSAHRSRDGSTLCNWMWVQGKSGPAAVVGNIEPDVLQSQSDYGLFEEKTDLGEVSDIDVLLAYAGAEVLLRKDPRQIWTIVPRQYVDGGSVPRIFDDYDIGDLCSLMVRKGTVQMEQPIAVRLFGASISIDEEGNEKISSLQTSPQ